MGIHRDGVRWNLPEEDIEERRIVFWNMQAADTFQANCFSRPNSIQGRYCDVQFPYDARLAESNGEERGYHTIKYQIAQLSAEYVVTSVWYQHADETVSWTKHSTSAPRPWTLSWPCTRGSSILKRRFHTA